MCDYKGKRFVHFPMDLWSDFVGHLLLSMTSFKKLVFDQGTYGDNSSDEE